MIPKVPKTVMFRGDVNLYTCTNIYNVYYQYTKDMITKNTFYIVLFT